MLFVLVIQFLWIDVHVKFRVVNAFHYNTIFFNVNYTSYYVTL